ncbi:MAG: iron-containing alcohol dehydrogenase [Mariniphaga sp.]
MGLSFEFATATKIVFGEGKAKSLPQLLNGFGRRVLLVSGKNSSRHDYLVQALQRENFEVFRYVVASEPTTQHVSDGAGLAREKECTAIVGLGGGSAVDAAKAIAALAPNKGNLLDYLEVIGEGKPLEKKPLPFIAVPTTAGTGAEVTKNAVILSPEHKVKVSLRSDLMFPRVAVIDPELTLSMPPELTAATGMDALTHLLETFVSKQSNPFIDLLCREGMHRIASSLETAYEDGSNRIARADMAFAAMLGGIALANVKLGAVHGFAGPMGGMFPVPHGAVCAALLPAVMKINYKAVERERLQASIEKYNELGRVLTGNTKAVAADGIVWVERMLKKLQMPRLSSYGLEASSFSILAEKAKNASSMKGNPVVLSDKELYEVLEMSG